MGQRLLSGQFHFDDRRINISVAQRADIEKGSIYESSIYIHHCVYVLVRGIRGCPRGAYLINHMRIEINQFRRNSSGTSQQQHLARDRCPKYVTIGYI